MAVDVSSYFRERRNQFHKNTVNRIWRSNPFRALVPMSEFPMSEGATPTVITYTHELPTSYPTLTAVATSNGSGNTACNPTSTTIKRGQDERTFSLGAASFKSDVFCLSDIKRAHQAAQAVAAFEKGMREYITVWWSDFYRLQNIEQIDYKVSTRDGAVEVSSTEGDFSELGSGNLPDEELDWPVLKELYFDIVRRGIAEEYSIGTAGGGAPVLPLIIGPGYYQKLFKDHADISEAVQFSDGLELLKVFGHSKAVNGFLPILDIFPIRFGKTSGISSVSELTKDNMIYPTTNTSATQGRKYVLNPNYKSVDRGGLAEYEVVTILPRSVYECHYEPIDPSSFAGLMDFKPTNYVGEWRFINQPTFLGDNDRGNLGYYLADVRVGAKAMNPDLGKTILTKVLSV